MIHRIQKTAKFAQISNQALRDTRLSYCARGILAMVMSHSDGWKTSTNWLREQTKFEGQVAVANAIKQLKDAGYLRVARVKGDDGKVSGCMWDWTDNPDEMPLLLNFGCQDDPHAEIPPDGLQSDGKPSTQNTIRQEHQMEEDADDCASAEAQGDPDEDKGNAGNQSEAQKEDCQPKPPSAPRKRDLVWEALLSETGIDPTTATKSQRSLAGKVASEIRAVQPNVSPEDIKAAAARFRAEWKGIPFTAAAFTKHWRSSKGQAATLPESTLTEVEAKIRACRGFHHHIDHEKATEEEHAEYARLVAKRRTML